MALLPKKTYSTQKSNVKDKEKESIDPFDELLSSPLKQEVHFQPLSFWSQKSKHVESSKKSKKSDFRLFETSDSDELNSPCPRKRKPKVKFTQPKARTFQPKSTNLKLSVRKNYSTANSFVKKNQVCNSNISEKTRTLKPKEEFEIYKGWSLNNNLNTNKITKQNLNLSHQNSDCCKLICPKNFIHKSNCVIHSNCKNLYSVEPVRKSKSNQNESFNDNTYIIPSSLVTSKVYDNATLKEEVVGTSSKKRVNDLESSGKCTNNFPKSVDKTLSPILLRDDSFKFVTVRRHFNNLNHNRIFNGDLSCSSTSVAYQKYNGNESQSWSEANKIITPDNLKFETDSMPVEFLRYDDETLIYSDDDSMKIAIINDKSLDATSYIMNDGSVLDEESKVERKNEHTVLCGLDLMCLNDTEVDDVVQELHSLQKANLERGVSAESSSTSDDTLSSFNDEDTVIDVALKTVTNESVIKGSAPEKDDSHVDSKAVSYLTNGISKLSIISATNDELTDTEAANPISFQHSEDKEKNSFLIDLKNITIKRRGFLNEKSKEKACGKMSLVISNEVSKEKPAQTELELDQSLWLNDRSLDWDKTISFANPMFESTRVMDITNQTNQSENSVLEETSSGLDHTYILKPGKKWMRSMSILKQLQNGSIARGRLESMRVKGRKFESFVQDFLEIQNKKSSFFTTLADETVLNNTLTAARANGVSYLKCKNIVNRLSEACSDHDFTLAKSFSNETFSHTVKVIQPEVGPSDFRSALGLEQEDAVKDQSSIISARDFILMQCGQEDVLPFEEYFNERTLKNCKKVGEGVYGEVFMYSDTVIKIIPIEGSDKVNGEPQKKFEEIISEVVIASKLSNLRKGEKHRTDGFSELKRCWCVKGKYPKYLLELWDEYDQSGGGSENDSPVMFKDGQLYIILELANGGKNLETFVFNSSAQSLSIFIQAAFSLAAAEKAFEFEHRDLHWGNVLISETKDKFASVIINDIKFKIPTKGVKVCIIDFTLSRINHEGCCIFNDLSLDPSLFVSEGDYQFEIYRMMLKVVKDDWSLFRPKTNIFWLHYMIDKMINMVLYKSKKSKLHVKYLKELKTLESEILEYKDSTDLVLSSSLSDVINKL